REAGEVARELGAHQLLGEHAAAPGVAERLEITRLEAERIAVDVLQGGLSWGADWDAASIKPFSIHAPRPRRIPEGHSPAQDASWTTGRSAYAPPREPDQ